MFTYAQDDLQMEHHDSRPGARPSALNFCRQGLISSLHMSWCQNEKQLICMPEKKREKKQKEWGAGVIPLFDNRPLPSKTWHLLTLKRFPFSWSAWERRAAFKPSRQGRISKRHDRMWANACLGKGELRVSHAAPVRLASFLAFSGVLERFQVRRQKKNGMEVLQRRCVGRKRGVVFFYQCAEVWIYQSHTIFFPQSSLDKQQVFQNHRSPNTWERTHVPHSISDDSSCHLLPYKASNPPKEFWKHKNYGGMISHFSGEDSSSSSSATSFIQRPTWIRIKYIIHSIITSRSTT